MSSRYQQSDNDYREARMQSCDHKWGPPQPNEWPHCTECGRLHPEAAEAMRKLITDVAETANETIRKMMEQFQAEGPSLDTLALTLGVERNTGEDDEGLRMRAMKAARTLVDGKRNTELSAASWTTGRAAVPDDMESWHLEPGPVGYVRVTGHPDDLNVPVYEDDHDEPTRDMIASWITRAPKTS